MRDPDAPKFSDDVLDEEPEIEVDRVRPEPSLRKWARRPSVQRIIVRNVK